MHYVVLEVQTTHLVEKPKDQCRISKFSYQIVEAESLVPHYDTASLPVIHMEQTGTISLQEAIEKFDKEIQSVIGKDSEFVICSLNSTWDVRVTIPRQAHDEGFILPSYLQHPKIFDLWKEYDRWSINHPEILSLRRNSGKRSKDLMEMLKMLEITENNLEDSVTLQNAVDILLQLHKRCSTAKDNSMVLTLPYDSYADIRSFLQEQSKVLYLNNLPPDTTQSELESWFTQFGARPIGFWTVKNIVEETSNVNNNWSINNSPYVEEQDSISGFVVFQTHEEAMDVLSLNGRSILSNMANTKQPRVVEHVVEIQPSSTRVLDRAQAILSPFPQSKNKPRPGDWNCPSCGFSNFQRRTSCFRCSFPSSSSQANTGKIYMNLNNSNTSSNTVSTTNGNSKATSPSQTQYSSNLHIQTQASQQIQQHSRAMTPTLGDFNLLGNQSHRYSSSNNNANLSYNNGTNNNNINGINNRFNSQSHGNSNGGGSNVPFRAGDWKCPTCTYHNFAKNVVCLRCGGPKITSIELENKLMINNNNSNSGTGNYNKTNMGNLMNIASMGSTASLNEYGNNRKGNGQFTFGNSNHGVSNSGYGVSLDVRSASEPKW